MAKEVLGEEPPAAESEEDLPPALAAARARGVEKAEALGLVAKWASYKKAKGYVQVHDPTTGEWHDLPWKDIPDWAKWEATERSTIYRSTGDAGAFDLTADQMREIWEEKHPPSEAGEGEGIVEEYELPDD